MNNNTLPVFFDIVVSSADSLSVYSNGFTSSWSFNAVGFRPDKCNLFDGRPFHGIAQRENNMREWHPFV